MQQEKYHLIERNGEMVGVPESQMTEEDFINLKPPGWYIDLSTVEGVDCIVTILDQLGQKFERVGDNTLRVLYYSPTAAQNQDDVSKK